MKTLLMIGLAALSTNAHALSTGQQAPDFELKNQDGKVVRLSDFKGKPVIVYFYPKDDTPGCTKEACQFRDEYAKFKQHGAVILGISRQDEKSHREFREKYHLPFDLLVDETGDVAKAYGVGKIPLFGFLHRESVLIGPDGKVVRFYGSVDPAKHAAQVLQDLATIAATEPRQK